MPADQLIGTDGVVKATTAGTAQTVASWLKRGQMPDPEVPVKLRLWRFSTVCAWAAAAGKLAPGTACPDPPMDIPDLMTAEDIAEMAGVATRTVLEHWSIGDRTPSCCGPLPEPLIRVPGGRILWLREDIEEWYAAAGAVEAVG